LTEQVGSWLVLHKWSVRISAGTPTIKTCKIIGVRETRATFWLDFSVAHPLSYHMGQLHSRTA
jgi:hypothetical protein